jgi:hypothetical protein
MFDNIHPHLPRLGYVYRVKGHSEITWPNGMYSKQNFSVLFIINHRRVECLHDQFSFFWNDYLRLKETGCKIKQLDIFGFEYVGALQGNLRKDNPDG